MTLKTEKQDNSMLSHAQENFVSATPPPKLIALLGESEDVIREQIYTGKLSRKRDSDTMKARVPMEETAKNTVEMTKCLDEGTALKSTDPPAQSTWTTIQHIVMFSLIFLKGHILGEIFSF